MKVGQDKTEHGYSGIYARHYIVSDIRVYTCTVGDMEKLHLHILKA